MTLYVIIYRDDCLRMWEMIHDFVSDIISIFYEDDEEVEKDQELANMLTDLRKNGFHPRADIKEKFDGIEALVKFLTIVIFRYFKRVKCVVNKSEKLTLDLIYEYPLVISTLPFA